MKFRKKPVVIEAMQFNGGADGYNVLHWLNDGLPANQELASWENDILYVPTLEGVMMASIGDWIIKGIAGEYYPCKPDIFEATYEAVE